VSDESGKESKETEFVRSRDHDETHEVVKVVDGEVVRRYCLTCHQFEVGAATTIRSVTDVRNVEVDDVWATSAGARLFNAVGMMDLVNRQGTPLLFSARLRLTKRMIELILDEGVLPQDMTRRLKGQERI
jgi:hypothetical protein